MKDMTKVNLETFNLIENHKIYAMWEHWKALIPRVQVTPTEEGWRWGWRGGGEMRRNNWRAASC